MLVGKKGRGGRRKKNQRIEKKRRKIKKERARETFGAVRSASNSTRQHTPSVVNVKEMPSSLSTTSHQGDHSDTQRSACGTRVPCENSRGSLLSRISIGAETWTSTASVVMVRPSPQPGVWLVHCARDKPAFSNGHAVSRRGESCRSLRRRVVMDEAARSGLPIESARSSWVKSELKAALSVRRTLLSSCVNKILIDKPKPWPGWLRSSRLVWGLQNTTSQRLTLIRLSNPSFIFEP